MEPTNDIKLSRFEIAGLLLLVLSISLTSGQGQPGGGAGAGTGATTVCSSKFENALAPTCFDANQVNFTGVLFVLTAERNGAIPEGYTSETFLKYMCSVDKQDALVPCVLKLMQQFGTPDCGEQDRAGVLGRGGQLLAFMDAICGEPCEQEATQSLIQCYTAINVNPEPILNPNATISDDKYSIVGSNGTEFDNFCSNRKKLFNCLSPLYTSCPGLLERLYTIGIDLQAMEIATELQCQDKTKYGKGLQCFNKPSPGITQCQQTTENNMKKVLAGRYQTGDIPPSKYMNNLCQAKLSQMECELSSYEQTCEESLSELRTVVECTMLPKPCRDNAEFQPVYNGICKKVTTPTPVTDRPTPPPGKPGPPATPRPTGGQGEGDGATAIAVSVVTMLLSALISLALTEVL